ncbi:MAG TPA: hypothetical protein VI749_01950 [Candidatus Omnitrophota bacterium]|nr:hypothetical protein [Candidatus Omnitrophota bacterium]
MSYKTIRNVAITVFVICWSLVYHYMSIKHFYLQPLVSKALPRVPMLFPPAGWIMFFNVDDQFGEVQVYGIKGVDLQVKGSDVYMRGKEYSLIDPHDVFRTRTILFDNIHRGLMHGAVGHQKPFCDFLEHRFPYYDAFEVRYVGYPSLTKDPHQRIERIYYQCLTQRYIKDELHQ